MDTTIDVHPILSEAERKRQVQEDVKREFSEQDAIMEPKTVDFFQQYLDAGGAPFNIMNMLMSSYEGLAAMANMASRDVIGSFDKGVSKNDGANVILQVLNDKIVDSFDLVQADSEFNETQKLPDYIPKMIEYEFWRKTIYKLSEKYPRCAMLGAAIQYIADKGYQAEMTTLSAATLHTHVFYSLLAECLDNVTRLDDIATANAAAAGFDDKSLQVKLEKLIKLVCQNEQVYFITMYIFKQVRDSLGPKSASIRRIEQVIDNYMLDRYGRPQLAINFRLLIEGLAVGGNEDPIANAIASIIQSNHAAPGDVVTLYKVYYNAYTSGGNRPPAHILRHERVMIPIIDQVFEQLWGGAVGNKRDEMVSKYIWVIAYGVLCVDDETGPNDHEMQNLIVQLKEVRTSIPVHPTMTDLNKAIPKIIEWINTPVLSRIVLLWLQDLLRHGTYTFYEMYFRSSEVPIPLLILEEIAYRQPLQKPMVFDVYKESFESKIPSFLPEKQLKLQKVVINRMAVLIQLGYAPPVLKYFLDSFESVDQSIIVYFINRTLAQFDAPYPEFFALPMLKLAELSIDGLRVAEEKEIASIRYFVNNVSGIDGIEASVKNISNALPALVESSH